MDGLEQRYGVEGVGSREKELFNKLNAIGKGEPVLFAQAVDEMKGHQYSNIQQRVQAIGNILDKEFDYLRSKWQTVTKDSNKIKIFGTRGEYKTDTAGVMDYKYHAYGVAYVHENEDIKLGIRTTLGVAYENKLGRVVNGKNKARVVDTSADWFNIRGEKEDRKGNVKFDLNVGYDTKGENLRGGLGLRVIF